MVWIDGRTLTCLDVVEVSRGLRQVAVTEAALDRVTRSWRLAGERAAARPVYGRTTGVGANRDVGLTPAAGLDEVTHDAGHGLRLLRSHAGGAGPLLPPEIVRAMLVVRVNQLCAGGAGVRPELVVALLELLDAQALPAVHRYGGVGTGDLTALAETALALLGERPWAEGDFRVVPIDSADALAFLSSNAATLGEAALAAHDLAVLADAALVVAALSFLAVDGNTEAYAEAALAGAPVAGQVEVGRRLRKLLADARPAARLQDPFGFRALPQVHGPVLDALTALRQAVEVQLNAAAENPLVSLEAGDVLHHGGFFTVALALALDTARAAVAQSAAHGLGRLAALAEPANSGLAPFLATGPPGSSGVMIVEYTVASALAAIRACAAPVVAGSVTLSRGVEDGASFSPEAARRTSELVLAYRVVVASELVVAVRALRQRGVAPRGDRLRAAYDAAAAVLDPDMADRDLAADLAAAQDLLDVLARFVPDAVS